MQGFCVTSTTKQSVVAEPNSQELPLEASQSSVTHTCTLCAKVRRHSLQSTFPTLTYMYIHAHVHTCTCSYMLLSYCAAHTVHQCPTERQLAATGQEAIDALHCSSQSVHDHTQYKHPSTSTSNSSKCVSASYFCNSNSTQKDKQTLLWIISIVFLPTTCKHHANTLQLYCLLLHEGRVAGNLTMAVAMNPYKSESKLVKALAGSTRSVLCAHTTAQAGALVGHLETITLPSMDPHTREV